MDATGHGDDLLSKAITPHILTEVEPIICPSEAGHIDLV